MLYPDAIWRPTHRHGYFGLGDICLNLGICAHSMEGSLEGAFGVLEDPNRTASWHFSVSKLGVVYQHVDTANIAWANGSFAANQRYWSIEHEGWAGEPLTELQLQATTALMRWLLESHGLAPIRGETLWEHNQMVIYGAAPTACPSGRIPWEYIVQEDDMTPEESQRLVNIETRLEAFITWMLGDPDLTTPEWENATHMTWDRIKAVETKVDMLQSLAGTYKVEKIT